MYAEPVTYRVPVFFRYGDERDLDKPEVNNNSDNSDKMAICGRKMLILERFCKFWFEKWNFNLIVKGSAGKLWRSGPNCERVRFTVPLKEGKKTLRSII